jgi:hypothetical protein
MEASKMRVKFKDLKLGMRFKIYSEDEPEQFTIGRASDIWEGKNGSVLVDFDDELCTFTGGKPDAYLPDCIEYLGEEGGN